MKVAYITSYDIFDSRNWPKEHIGLFGAGYYLSQALAQNAIALEYLGPLQKKKSPITRGKWLYYRHIYNKDYYSWAEPLIIKYYAQQVEIKIKEAKADLVLCPENVMPIAYVKSPQPLVLWTDATLGSLVNFYPHLSNLCAETKKNIYVMEKRALSNCDLVIFTSDWAAEKAKEIYHILPKKIKVIPWGANIQCNRTTEDIHHLVRSRDLKQCQLLFIGRDWLRKGGDVALEVAQGLNKVGLKTSLLVVGSQPLLKEPIPDLVRTIGYIDKSNPSGKKQFESLLSEAHFLILPTRADCSPHVTIEANSFGVPCLTTEVGGITTIIKDGINGKIFAVDADSSNYCRYISDLFNQQTAYQQLAMSSFNEYQTRLNWSVAGKTAKKLFEELVS